MADKRNSERPATDDQGIGGGTDERVRGVAEEGVEFEDSEDLEEDDEAEEDEGNRI
jgi:hypothetical protein